MTSPYKVGKGEVQIMCCASALVLPRKGDRLIEAGSGQDLMHCEQSHSLLHWQHGAGIVL